MRNEVLGAWCIMACICALLGSAARAEDRAGTCAGGTPSISVSPDGTIVAADGEAYIPAPRPLPDDVEIESLVAHGDGWDGGNVSESAVSVLVYNNDLSSQLTGPAGSAATARVADDVAITVKADCLLEKYVVRVTGDRENTGSAPAFTVNTALYKTCPGAGGGVTPITGSTCSFPTSGLGVKELTCLVPGDVKLPDNFYVSISFSRDNCGIVVGAPPQLGFSADQFDFPGFPCRAYLGGYPAYRHASFWLQIYAKQDCGKSFVAYKNTNHAGNSYTPGAGVYFADDIRLSLNTCNMVAYEVSVKGFGIFRFDLRTFLSNANPETGGVIPGTEKSYLSTENKPQVARFAIDPPITMPPNFYISFKTSSALAGPIFTNQRSSLGTTEDQMCVYRDGEWQCGPYSQTTYAAFDVTIICEGEPPVGACCDMVQVDAQGESVCRHVPEMNCGQDPAWNLWKDDICDDVCVGGTNNGQPCTRQADCPGYSCVGGTRNGLTCDPAKPQTTECPGGFCRKAKCPGPFPFPCGQSACCTHDDYCFNYTENECNARPPVDKPRLYLRGNFCAYQGFSCPWGACLGREGLCSLPHPWPGCENPFCCTAVCRIDSFCCLVEWDPQCASNTFRYCEGAPSNDECWDPDPLKLKGARLVGIPSSTESDNLHATENVNDPGFCCHKENPGAIGYGTVWYKFVAVEPTASVKTCFSNSPATDSIISVYSPSDPDRGICTNGAPCSVAGQDCADQSRCELDEQYACSNLNLIGCSDDVQFCSASNKNSTLCLTGLTVGQTYYVLVASKPDINPGDYPQLAYRLDVVSPCTNLHPPMPNDFCKGAEQVVEKCVGGAENGTPCDPSVQNDCPGGVCRVAKAFDMTGEPSNGPATFDCPGEPCVDPLMQNDLWYTWNAPCNGRTEVTTCAPGVDPEQQAPTTMVVYNACQCPVQVGTVVGCSIGALGDCGLASKVTFDAVDGECYQIRLGGQSGGTPAGELRVSVVCVGCVNDAECNDDNVCTTDTCVGGSCVNTPNAAACNDGVFCNGADTCGGGTCSVHAGNPCAPGGCDEENDRCLCPSGLVTFVSPASGTVDARQPYPSNNSAQRQGIRTFRVTGPTGFQALNCWTLCETGVDGTANSITSIVSNGDGSFNVNLARTISIGAVTTLTYTEGGGTRHRGVFTAHPANVNADSASNAADILRIIDILNNVLVPPWGIYSCDADQSTVCNPADILRVIDLLNGTDQFDTWLGIGLPACGACCP